MKIQQLVKLPQQPRKLRLPLVQILGKPSQADPEEQDHSRNKDLLFAGIRFLRGANLIELFHLKK